VPIEEAEISNYTEFFPVGAELFHADGDKHDEAILRKASKLIS
jgi:hypothetical protein